MIYQIVMSCLMILVAIFWKEIQKLPSEKYRKLPLRGNWIYKKHENEMLAKVLMFIPRAMAFLVGSFGLIYTLYFRK